MGATSKTNVKLGKIDLSKVNVKALDATLESCEINPIGTLEEKIEAYNDWTRKNCDPSMVGDCDNCGASSDATHFPDACPVCGELASEDEPVDVDAAPPEDKKSKPHLELVPGGAEKKAKGSVDKKSDKKSDKKNKTAMVATPVPSETAKTMTKAVKAEIVGDASQLDAAVSEIKEFEKQAGVHAYHACQKLIEIYSSQLWKTRMHKGKVAYKTFEQFTKAELNMTKRYAHQMMAVAKRFTPEQIKEIGPSKLGLILQAPKEMREDLVEKAKKGASKRDIEREIPRNKKPSKKDAEKKDKSTKGITIATIIGRKTIKLFAKPASKSSEPKPAKRIGDVPIGSLDLTNDVRQHFQVTANAAGELQLVIKTERIEE